MQIKFYDVKSLSVPNIAPIATVDGIPPAEGSLIYFSYEPNVPGKAEETWRVLEVKQRMRQSYQFRPWQSADVIIEKI